MSLLHRRVALVAVAAVAAATASLALPVTGAWAALGQPTPLTPASGDANDPSAWQKDPVLTWSPVTGASAYDVELSNSNDFTDAASLYQLPNNGRVQSPSMALPQTLDHGAYFWRVRAVAGTTLGHWSSESELLRGWDDVPTSNPQQVTNDDRVDWGSDINAAPWRFSWQAIPDASSYEIEFSTDPTFPSDPKDASAQSGKWNDGKTTLDCLTTHTTFSVYGSVFGADRNVDGCDFTSFDPASAPVFWRVRGVDDSAKTALTGPQAQTLDCFGTPQESSTQFPNAGASTGTAFGTPSSPSHECSLWSATRSVSVPVTDGASDPTTYGPLSAVIIGCGAPTTSASAPDAYTCTDTPEIAWHPVQDAGGVFANTYVVTIADDAAFTNVERIYQTSGLSLQPRDEFRDYLAGRGYYVSVQPCSLGGSCGAKTTLTFKKQTPQIASVAAQHVNGAERFVWQDLLATYPATSTYGQPGVEAEHYLLQITDSSDSDFSTPVLSDALDRSCDTSLAFACYQPGGSPAAGDGEAVEHVADGTYLWRVVPVDLSGNRLRASQAQTVTIDTTPPQLRLTTSNGLPVNGRFTITSNEPVTGVSSSSVNLVAVAGGAVTSVTVAPAAAANTWTLTPTRRLVTGQRYALQIIGAIHDAAQNSAVVAGSPVRTTTLADNTSAAWQWPSGWSRVASSNAIGGSYERAGSGHVGTLQVVGSQVNVYGCKGPKLATLVIKIDGVKKAAVSEHQSFSKCGVLLWSGPVSSAAVHMIQVATSGGAAGVDAVRVS